MYGICQILHEVFVHVLTCKDACGCCVALMCSCIEQMHVLDILLLTGIIQLSIFCVVLSVCCGIKMHSYCC